MAEPTPEELQARIEALEALITATYEPPSGAQYSYPVASQGITQDQWQQMHITGGDGTIIRSGSYTPFWLVGHDTDAETNQRNTMILKVAATGMNEAQLAGFYWRQTEDIELPFPPVTTNTTYYVTITYDPRKFKTEPLRLEVWANDLPRSQGQQHIILWEVERRPNQLLSQATTRVRRHYVSPVISAASFEGLPDPTDVLYGTVGIVRSRSKSGDVLPGTGQIYESHTTHGWKNLLLGDWEDIEIQTGNGFSGIGELRWRSGGIDLTFAVSGSRPSSPSQVTMFQLPSGYNLSRSFYSTVFTTDGPANFQLTQTANERVRGALVGPTVTPSWTRGGLFIPDHYISKVI